MSKHINFQKKKEIVSYYQSKPMTIYECANKYNISCPTLIKILDAFKIKRYGKAILFSPELDQHYFDCIDNPQKAYWLGLMVTDGCVHTKKTGHKILCLTLKTEDEYIIQKFLSDIKCNKNIVRSKGRNESSIQISSDILCNSLQKYGIHDRKTGCEKFICPNYKQAYIRGLIDGDGSISFYARPDRNAHVKAIRLCCSNKIFLEDVVSFVGCGRIQLSHEGLWTITWNSNDNMMKVINCIRTYSTIHLIRKDILIDKIVEQIGKYRDNRNKAAS